ncbi:MAG: ABC transporter substrate-binding protein [Candidatus Limnocylindria bacterium]
MRTRFIPLAFAFALTLGVAACTPTASPSPSQSPSAEASASASPSADLREVRLLLGFRPDVQFAPFYLAQQGGYFADAGLEVTIEHADAGELIRLVASGEAEFGVADATDVMIARTSDIPVKYVSTLYQYFPVALIGPAGTVPTDPADLAGLRIGTPGRFGSSWHALLALLGAGGLTADDVTIREYPQFNQVEGLLNGDVDLITGFRNNEPLRLAAEGVETDLLTVDDIAPLPGPGVIVRDELLAADEELVHDFVVATVFAQQAIAADSERGLRAAVEAVPTIAEDEATALAVLE